MYRKLHELMGQEPVTNFKIKPKSLMVRSHWSRWIENDQLEAAFEGHFNEEDHRLNTEKDD